MKILLSIDLSTNCTGWAVFTVEDSKLVTYGRIKGKNFKDTSSQRATLRKMEFMATSVLSIIQNYKPNLIVIEEIAGSKNRIGQKTLDMAHGILWKTIDQYLDIVNYYDVSGAEGWRTNLGLKLSESDKLANKEAKKLNPNLAPESRLPIYDAKDLAARYVNKKYGLALDPQTSQTDSDVADAVSLGDAFIQFRYPRN